MLSLHGPVFNSYCAAFPTARAARRSNPAAGIPDHCIPEAYWRALTRALETTLPSLILYDLGAGSNDLPGTSLPVPFLLPAIPAALSQFLLDTGWSGPHALQVASFMVSAPLLEVVAQGRLRMDLNPLLGTGVGIVSPASNPGLFGTARAALEGALLAAFTDSYFSVDDLPGNPPTPQIVRTIPHFATAYATAIASLTAAVPYTGSGIITAPVAGVVNRGQII